MPKFSGDGKTIVDEHFNALNVASRILVIQHEDVCTNTNWRSSRLVLSSTQ